MWANHDWVDIHPAQRSQPYNTLANGSYLEPDVKHGMGYLEAIRNVFGD